MRIPRHIGIIPDGNRRWAAENGLAKEDGYAWGLKPGIELLRLCKNTGIEEVTYYGFTCDNNKRPVNQREAFTRACIEAVHMLYLEGADLLVVGNAEADFFPKELKQFTERKTLKEDSIKVNFLVNYGWDWDIANIKNGREKGRNIIKSLNSRDVSRIDMVIRWGGRRRLSGFLPLQTVYSDFYIIDEYWPDFKEEHFTAALKWYEKQDVTLGG